MIFGVVIIGMLVITALTYNKLIDADHKARTNLAQIDVQIKRKAKLIPELTEVLKIYMTYESHMIDKLLDLAEKVSKTDNTEERFSLDQEITKSLNVILDMSKKHEDLKTNEQFVKLQKELVRSEDKIAYAKQFYNDAAGHYNAGIEKFPGNIIASVCNFAPYPYYHEQEDNMDEDLEEEDIYEEEKHEKVY